MRSASRTLQVGAEAVSQEFEDGRSYNPQAVRQITQEWVDTHMKDRESQFTESVKASIFVGTWNVNAKKQEGGLHDWLLPKDQPPADVYAVGFQEIVDLNAMNVALDGSKTQSRALFWGEHIAECLQSTGVQYRLITQKTLVGLLLGVYVKESIAAHIKDVRATQAAVGIMGMMGNKGGVSIRMSIFDSSVCFVCAHLAAHRDNVAGRNSDFKNIIERSVFVADSSAAALADDDAHDDEISGTVEGQVVRPRHGAEKSQSLELSILDHELVFWLGDLNYRIDEELSTEQVFQLIQQGNLAYLRERDQLNLERAKGAVFQGFAEGVLQFQPTYKYQPGTDLYEQRAEKKLRAPAWCDRVLWRTSNPPGTVRQLTYSRSELKPSDHKPVYSLFNCDLRLVNSEKERGVYQELMRTLEFWRNNQLPEVAITGLVIALNSVKFEVPVSSVLQIRNTSQTTAHWHFVRKLEERSISKRWVSVDKQRGLLLPQESVDVRVTVNVDRKTAQLLNLGKETLDDILVLRVENCQDQYVSVSAAFERSCYGMSLEELLYTPGPVRMTSLPCDNTSSSSSATAGNDDHLFVTPDGKPLPPKPPVLKIPKEVWRIVDALWKGGALKEKDLFVPAYAVSAEVAAIRESLDSNVPFPSCTPHSLCEALVSLLAALPRPLLPPDIYPSAAVEPQNLRPWCTRFLESLPAVNYTVFVYLLSFMREVLAQGDYNRSTPARLSAVLVQCLTPSATDPDILKDEKQRREGKQQDMQAVIEFLLTTTAL